MTLKEREAIQQALASTIELLNDMVSALNTVRGAAAVMGEGLEGVQEDLASIARLIGSDGETPEPRRKGSGPIRPSRSLARSSAITPRAYVPGRRRS
jgi:hypothetical protein